MGPNTPSLLALANVHEMDSLEKNYQCSLKVIATYFVYKASSAGDIRLDLTASCFDAN